MLVFLHHSLAPHCVITHDPDYEILHITLTLHSTPLHIFATYIPFPTSQPVHSAAQHFQHLTRLISAVRSSTRVIILGDLNSRIAATHSNADTDYDANTPASALWPDSPLLQSIPPRHSAETIGATNMNAKKLLKMCQQLDLVILNGRGHNSGSLTHPSSSTDRASLTSIPGGSVIDYGISTPYLFSQLHLTVHEYLPGVSDHCLLSLTLQLDRAFPRRPRYRKPTHRDIVWTPSQQESYRSQMQECWRHFTPGPCLLSSIEDTLLQSLQQLISAPAPRRKPMPPWMSPETIALHRQYRQALTQHRRRPTESTVHQLRDSRRRYRTSLRRDKRRVQLHQAHELLHLSRHRPAKFWQLVKPRDPLQRCVLDPSRLAVHIRSLYAAPPPLSSPPPPTPFVPPHETLCRPFDAQELQLASFYNTGNGISCGPDGIPNELLRYNSIELFEALATVFNQHFSSATYPSSWKESVVHALHKKGDATDPNNYRLLNINSTLGKLYSVCLNNRLADFVEDQLSDFQFGFRARRSTEMATLVLLSYIRHAVARGKRLYLIFVDFQKAFDTVNRDKLFLRLLNMQVPTTFVDAIRAMYADLRARIRNHPDLIPLELGVKQGDPLSPLLFALYINRLEGFLKERGWTGYRAEGYALLLLLYADDTVLVATSKREAEGMFRDLQEFCTSLGLTINIDKTEAMVINGPQTPLQSALGPIAVVDEFKYLGTTIHRNGSLSTHLQHRQTQGIRAKHQWESFRSNHPAMAPAHLMQVFEGLCTPKFMFGCHLERLQQSRRQVQTFNQLRTSTMIRLLGVSHKCSRVLLHGSFDLWPLDWHLLHAQGQLYIKCRSLPPSSIAHIALSLDHSLPKQWSWVKQLRQALSQYQDIDIDTIHPELFTGLLKQHWRHQLLADAQHLSSASLWLETRSLLNPLEPDWLLTSPQLDIHTRMTLVRLKLQPQALPLARYLGHNHPSSRLRHFLSRTFCPCCRCFTAETVFHFVVECPKHDTIRTNLISSIRSETLRTLFLDRAPDCIAHLLSAPSEVRALRLLVRLIDHRTTLATDRIYDMWLPLQLSHLFSSWAPELFLLLFLLIIHHNSMSRT